MKKRKKGSPFSRLRMGQKFLIIDIAALAVIIVMLCILTDAIRRDEQNRRDMISTITVTSAEQCMNTAIETGVSVARSLYTNAKLAAFLNTEYSSSAVYFDAYYQFQQDENLPLAELNIVKDYTIYSANTTIMSGGNIRSLESVRNAGWYQTLLRKNKSIILYCDPDSHVLSLIRKLDYYDMNVGECILKLDLNTSALEDYCDALGFDGELDITCEGALLYSNAAESMEEVRINQDFQQSTKNYYTVDIEYYARTAPLSIFGLLTGNWVLMVLLGVTVVLMVLFAWLLVRELQKRIRRTETLYQQEGNVTALRAEDNGQDEIGRLIRICIALSDKVSLKTNQHQHVQEQLSDKQESYNRLYQIAVRQDVQLSMQRLYPALCTDKDVHTLSEEMAIVREVVSAYPESAVDVPKDVPADFDVPVYALALVVDDLLRTGNEVVLSCTEDTITLHCQNVAVPPPARMLKLGAIFEEGNISSEYFFRPQYAYNPYLYLKYTLDDRVQVLITRENGFFMDLTISK